MDECKCGARSAYIRRTPSLNHHQHSTNGLGYMYVIDQAGLDIGDIILFSKSREYRASSDSIAARRYYHAAIWVGGTLIHATADGVYSTNLQRVHFSNADDAVVLRPKTPLFPSEAKVIANYARSLTGSLYAFSEVELARSGRRQKIGEAATKRQFCSRLVALAYAQAGISITRSANPMYCTPRMISLSSILTPVLGMLRLANALEIEMEATPDPIRINQEQCYFWLNGIRKIVAESPNLYSAWDIRHRQTLFALAHYIAQIDDSGQMMTDSGVAIEHVFGTVDRRCRASSVHHSAPFLRLAGGQRQPGQIFREELAAFGGDQPITEERKTGPRAGEVNTVVRVELNHAAISSLAGV